MMSAFEEHREELEHYEQMFGRDRGRLAVSLDRLTNALVLVGQHAVFPRFRRWTCASSTRNWCTQKNWCSL